jgi:hypothetical protein
VPMISSDGGGAREAGAEMDRQIAERVMGWHVFGSSDLYAYWTEPYLGEKRLGDMLALPRFSTSIEAAWLIAERLRAIGLGVIIASEADGWEVEIITTEALYERGYRGVYRCDAMAPLAICTAALFACEAALGATARAQGDE